MLLWAVALFSVITALVALVAGRRLTRRLDGLTQSYWDLRYEQSRLRADVSRLSPDSPSVAEEAQSPSPSVAYVPLASLKTGSTKSD